MKALLTGHKGRIGSRVLSLLHEQDYEVIGYDIADDLDVRDLGHLIEYSRECDVIIHLAAIPHPQKGSIEQYFRINVEGTFNVLQAADRNEVKRVVYASSTGYYGLDTNIKGKISPLYLPIDETHPPAVAHQRFYGWLSAYNISKVMAEQLVAWYGTNTDVQTVALRIAPANSKEEQYPKRCLARLKKDDWRLSVMMANCHPDYAAAALVLAADLDRDLPGWSVFNIADEYLPAGFSPEMAQTLFGIETCKSLIDTTKAQQVLEWQPCRER